MQSRNRRKKPTSQVSVRGVSGPGFSGLANRTPQFAAAISASPLHACAYWDAIGSRVPPHLPTTFGNFTCVNSITRFSFTTLPNQYTQFVIGYYPCGGRIYAWSAANLTSTSNGFATWQQQQLNPSNTVPLDIRPLRMSLRLRNVTQNLNLAGAVTAVQVPQSLALTFSAANTLNAATVSSLWNLCASSPMSNTLTGKSLVKPHTMVCAPSSYIAYNTYSDWNAITTDSGTGLNLADWQLLFSQPGITPIFPYTPINGLFGTVPAMYNTLLNFEPNALAQTFEFEMFCQDGIRYPANSMAAAVATRGVHAPGNILSEAHVSASAAQANDQFVQPSDSISQVGSAISGLARMVDGASVSDVTRVLGYAGAARSVASGVLNASNLMKMGRAARYAAAIL